jgi:serine protease Do
MFRRFVLIVALVAVATGFTATAIRVQGQSAPPAVRGEPVSFREVVKSVLPAVVSIDSKSSRALRRLPANRNDDDDNPDSFRRFFGDLERRNADPQNERVIGKGSGFIIDAKGVILTNFHVIDGADAVDVTLGDGRKFTSRDIKGDQRTDLAIVRFDPKGSRLPVIELGDSAQMEIGDRVLAIGAPFGLSGSVTQGIISAKGRDLNLNRYDDFLQTDAAINRGNSGGPLVNLDGKAVGINSAITTGTGGFQGVSLAIPSNMARPVVQQLMRDGTVRRPYLGIEAMADLRPEVLAQFGAANGGVVIAKVRDVGPAAKAGLRADDAIVTLNNQPVADLRGLQKIIAGLPISSAVEVGIVRDGKPLTLRVTLEEEPKNYGLGMQRAPRRLNVEDEAVTVEGTGIEIVTVSANQAERQGLPSRAGVVITGVERGSAAETARLQPGMMILKVNRKSVETAAQAKQMIEAGLADQGALLHVQIGDAVTAIMLPPR